MAFTFPHWPKSNPNFRDKTLNVVEIMILHDIFRVVSGFPRYISCYIAESRLSLGQCILVTAEQKIFLLSTLANCFVPIQ